MALHAVPSGDVTTQFLLSAYRISFECAYQILFLQD